MNDFEKIEKEIELKHLRAEIDENIKSSKYLIEQLEKNIKELENLKEALKNNKAEELYNNSSCVLHAAPSELCNKINIKNVRIDGSVNYIALLDYIERTYKKRLANS